jgi:hypothetical protein
MNVQDWPEPWVAVTDESQRSALLAELARELSPGHVLLGATLRVLAQSEAADDVLFEVEGRNFRLAEVHLTWGRETNPRYPRTAVFLSLEEWRVNLPEWS